MFVVFQANDHQHVYMNIYDNYKSNIFVNV